ncbi:MAG: hypothetical protein HGA44_21710 [Cellulomonadaceae bacterium]|nr:hypothetical protein [Cellulomonadaceae bacterium]
MPARTRRLLACATSIAAAVGLLAGCTGTTQAADPTATASPTATQPSPSATPSPNQAAAAPQWTPAMDEVSADGARDVAQYFLQLFPYVIETGDTSEWDRLSHPECLYCADVSRYARDSSSLTSAPEVSLTFESVEELDPGVLFMVSLRYVEAFDDGTTKPFSGLVSVVRQGEQWLIRGVQLDVVAE